MPELPEVEVLARHLAPLVRERKIISTTVLRAKVLRPTSPVEFQQSLVGATFLDLSRRGKYLIFQLRSKQGTPLVLLGHLGMTGRMYLAFVKTPLPKHAAVVLCLGPQNFIYEDTRYFGRLTLDASSLVDLGPEPLAAEFTVESFAARLKTSSQPIKVKLLDQSVVAGVGNIYASEALHRAGISPRLAARRLKSAQVTRLRQCIRQTLADAIKRGSTLPLNYAGAGARDGLFYFGQTPGTPDYYSERLLVYDRAGQPCRKCNTAIKRLVQAARSTFYCPNCQRG